MKILFLHPNMPGQYKYLARAFGADPANQVVFLTKPKPKVEIPGVVKLEYKVSRDVSPETHRYMIAFERGVLHAQEVWRMCKKMKDEGFVPDVIVGHFGWGDGMFLKDIFPDTPSLGLMEFFYNSRGADVGFLPDGELTEDEKAKLRVKNSIHLQNLTFCDWGVCPTHFQRDRHPEIFHSKLSVIHDGIDTDTVVPGTGRGLHLPSGITLKPHDEVITYISRNFEPYRGFPQFMRAVKIIQERRPNAHVIMVGQDDISYGKKPKGGKTWRQIMMEEVRPDKSRFHFLGYLPHDQMLKVMQISSAHIYLTVPFVLSWSMMEAMAAGCALIASDTAPVREVVTHGHDGLLVDFFSPEAVAGAADAILDHKDRMQEMRNNARQTIMDRYALSKVLPLQMDLVRDIAARKFPPPAAEKIRRYNEETSFRPARKNAQKKPLRASA